MAGSESPAAPVATDVDVVVVGAGFSGLYLLHRLRTLGFTVKVLEAGDGVGGTWYWNRYPGARCDVESMEYCYSFSDELQQEWQWSSRYPAQPEIQKYLDHVADRFDLRRDIELQTLVTAAHYDDTAKQWTVTTATGRRVRAPFCIMATGCLSTTRLPPFPGLEKFKGRTYHTGSWPKEPVDFTGLRMGCIGTGSSGIQVIPQVAAQAEHLYVFQRTPNFSIPAHNAPLDPQYARALKARYPEHRANARASAFGVPCDMTQESAVEAAPEHRERRFEAAWAYGGATRMLLAFGDLLVRDESNALVAEFVRGKIREIVKDPAVAERLCPTDHPLGAKRICVDTDYYATFNRPNVTLVDLRQAPIEAFTETALCTRDASYELDGVIFATGFDAMTGTLLNIDIRGRDGLTLRSKWEHGPLTYLGVSIAGFPNLFIMTGPGSPSVLSNMVVSIEQHVEWTTDCIDYLRRHRLRTIEADPEAESKWVAHVNEVANFTLFPKANSWYTGANVPGKPRIFMPYVGGVGTYADICRKIAGNGYEGFTLGA